MSDGKSWVILKYVTGPEWSWIQDTIYAGARLNLVDSVLLSNSVPTKQGHAAVQMRPVIFFEFLGLEDRNKAFGIVNEGNPDTAGVELYDLPSDINDPSSILPDLADRFRTLEESVKDGEGVGVVGNEIAELQYMALIGDWVYTIFPFYFDP
jgi:hypothetical protein